MKNTFSFWSIFSVLFLVLISCTKSENSIVIDTSSTIQQGQWKVTLYNDSGTDETHHFTGFAFTFNANGSVTAVKNTTTVNGTWATRRDSGQNKFDLNFGNTVPFDELNDDWKILENTSNRIRLEDMSGGGSGTDLLTFEKI
jgi:hypothetical protein